MSRLPIAVHAEGQHEKRHRGDRCQAERDGEGRGDTLACVRGGACQSQSDRETEVEKAQREDALVYEPAYARRRFGVGEAFRGARTKSVPGTQPAVDGPPAVHRENHRKGHQEQQHARPSPLPAPAAQTPPAVRSGEPSPCSCAARRLFHRPGSFPVAMTELRDLLAPPGDLCFRGGPVGGELGEKLRDREWTGHEHRHGRVRLKVSRRVRFAVAAQETLEAVVCGSCS